MTGCRFATFPDEDYADQSKRSRRVPVLGPEDSLFPEGSPKTLPAMLIGVRPARHLLLWEGYFVAADLLMDACVSDPRHALRLVYPILFAYRHAIEVALKFVLDFYGSRDAPATHDLLALWDLVRPIYEINCDVSAVELDSLQRVLRELASVDPGSTSFRYTWRRRAVVSDTVDNPQDRDTFELDLATVRVTMERVQQFLDEMDGDLMNCGFDPRD